MDAKTRKKFKQIAHHLDPIIAVGDQGLSASLLAETDRALTDHELIKVKLHSADRGDRELLGDELIHADRGGDLEDSVVAQLGLDPHVGVVVDIAVVHEAAGQLGGCLVVGILELDGGVRAIARPSGTEPKIKFYILVRESDPDLGAARAAARAKIDAVRDDMVARAGG